LFAARIVTPYSERPANASNELLVYEPPDGLSILWSPLRHIRPRQHQRMRLGAGMRSDAPPRPLASGKDASITVVLDAGPDNRRVSRGSQSHVILNRGCSGPSGHRAPGGFRVLYAAAARRLPGSACRPHSDPASANRRLSLAAIERYPGTDQSPPRAASPPRRVSQAGCLRRYGLGDARRGRGCVRSKTVPSTIARYAFTQSRMITPSGPSGRSAGLQPGRGRVPEEHRRVPGHD
jgi:hypothetical protein